MSKFNRSVLNVFISGFICVTGAGAWAAPTVTFVSKIIPTDNTLISAVPYWVNDQGTVVGVFGSHPFRFTPPSTFEDISSLIGSESTPRQINDDGEIIFQPEPLQMKCKLFDKGLVISIACPIGMEGFQEDGDNNDEWAISLGNNAYIQLVSDIRGNWIDYIKPNRRKRIQISGLRKFGFFASPMVINSTKIAVVGETKQGDFSIILINLRTGKISRSASIIHFSRRAGTDGRRKFLFRNEALGDFNTAHMTYEVFEYDSRGFHRHQLQLPKSFLVDRFEMGRHGDLFGNGVMLRNKGNSKFQKISYREEVLDNYPDEPGDNLFLNSIPSPAGNFFVGSFLGDAGPIGHNPD